MSNTSFRVAAYALVTALAVLLIASALQENQTWDEAIHLSAGYGYLETGNYKVNPEHPALGKILCALPVWTLFRGINFDRSLWDSKNERDLGFELLYHSRASPEWILFAARFVTILLTLLFAAWLAFWSNKRFGPKVALVALTFFVLDPNITAHGRYVTTDVIASLFIFVSCSLWIDYLMKRSCLRLAAAGISLGLALASKYSTIFLIPVWMLMYLIADFAKHRNIRALSSRITAFAGVMIAVLVCAAAVVGLVYAPEIMNSSRLGKLEPLLSGEGMLAPFLQFASHTLDLPAYTYLQGLDAISYKDAWGHAAYLLGEVRDLGWWYYFPVAFLVKTPVSILCAIVLAAVYLGIACRRRLLEDQLILLLVSIPAFIYAGFCIKSHVNIGIRHLLPSYAFLYVVVSYSLVRVGGKTFPTAAPAAVMALLAILAVESLTTYPNYLAYFNFLVGGPSQGPRYLLDSNLDWGQDARKLGSYLKSHDIKKVCICYFGTGDLAHFGVFATNIPDGIEAQKQLDCLAAISATPLFGLYVPPDRFRYFRAMTPVAKIGYSIYLYDLRKGQAGRIRVPQSTPGSLGGS